MDLTIHTTFLPHDDPEAPLAFYRDALGFEVRSDVGQGAMRWITVGPPDQPGTSIVLDPPAVDPGHHRRRATHDRRDDGQGHLRLDPPRDQGPRRYLRAGAGRDAEVVQEPTEQPYGVRDCAFRDPAGNLVRIQELR